MTLSATVVWLLSATLIALTVLPLWSSPRWWIRIWDYPRAQLAVALAGALAGQLALASVAGLGVGTAALLAATLACLAWQCWQIRRYTPLARAQSLPAPADPGRDGADGLSLLIANVLQSNRAAAGLLRQIEAHDPDVVLLLETDGWWHEALAPLRARYPHAVARPQDNTYGLHLFSRLPLSDVDVRDRVTRGIPSVFARIRLRSGVTVDLYGLHPEPPRPANDVAESDAELLLVAQDVARRRRPAIVMGDLNDVAWSHTTRLFQRMGGLLDPRIGRGLYPTFHAEYALARWPLDHVFHSPHFRLAGLRVLEGFGSDHFPIFVALDFDPAAVALHDVPTADAGDRREAEERVADGLEAAAEAGTEAGAGAQGSASSARIS